MGPLSGNKMKEISSITVKNNDEMNVKFLREQLQLHSDLSKALEEKLEQRNHRIKSLQHELQAKESAFQDLQNNFDDQVIKIQDLEETCVARSAKVSQLVQVIAAKKTSEIQEALLEKSLQVADLIQERHKLERNIVNLEEELATTKVMATKLKQDRDKNNKLLLELSDIVRTLNTIAVEYEKVDNKTTDDDSATSNSSASMPMNQPLRNVKRKIQAIEHDRQRLVRERDLLKLDNEAKDAQIADLEKSFRLLNDKVRLKNGDGYDCNALDSADDLDMRKNGDAWRCNDPMEDSPRGFSLQEIAEEKKDDADSTASPAHGSSNDKSSHHVIYTDMGKSLSVVEEDVSSTSSSSGSESSFSTLEAPPSPTIPLKEHEELKLKFEKALDVIETLRNELSKRIRREGKIRSSKNSEATNAAEVASVNRQLGESSEQVKRLEGKIERMRVEHFEENDNNRSLIQDLRRELEERRRSYEESLLCSKLESEEAQKMNGILKQQYNDLETEYTMKIDLLEQQIKDCQIEKQQSLSELQELYKEQMENKTREHNKAMEEKEQALHDLKFEYDTFLEVHLKMEEEANKEKELYKEALKRIVSLEQDLLEIQDKLRANTRAHQEELSCAKEKKTEAVQKYNQLKHGYELLVVKHTKELEESSAKFEKLHEENKQSVKNYERQVAELNQKHKELRHDFDDALIEHGKKMQLAELQYQKLKSEYDVSVQAKNQEIDDLKLKGKSQMNELIEQLKKESRDELDKQALKFKELLEQQRRDAEIEADRMKKISDEEIEKVKSDSQRVLKKRQAEFLEMLDQCQRAKEEGETRLTSKLDEQKKDMFELRAHTTKQLEKQRHEAQVILEKVQTELREEINRLIEENSSLQEHKREGDDMKVLYRELASSYQSSLVTIEMLIKTSQSRRMTMGQNCADVSEKSGSVMEKIRALEKQSGKIFRCKPGFNSFSKRPNSDPTFQRDFIALLERLGLTEDATICEREEEGGDHKMTSSFACSSVSVESVLARKCTESAQNCAENDSTEATGIKSFFHEGAIHMVQSKHASPYPEMAFSPLFEDLLRHFVRTREVNSAIVSHGVPAPKDEYIDKVEQSLHPCIDTNALMDARINAERVQAENIRHKIKENAAEIVSQAREKELRLLERQFHSLRTKFEEVLQTESATASHGKDLMLKDIDNKRSNDDPSHRLILTLSSVTSEGGFTNNASALNMSEVDYLRKQLLGAELKAKVTQKKLDSSKMLVNEARKQREEGSRNLETVMGDFDYLDRSNIYRRHNLTGPLPAVSQRNSQETDNSTCLSPLPMIKVDKWADTAVMTYLDCEEESKGIQPKDVTFSHCMQSIQDELKQTRQEAIIAKQKQLEREENLHDVILQYKALQKEYDDLSKSLGQQTSTKVGKSYFDADSENITRVELANKHEAAQIAIRDFQEKLDGAQTSLFNAQAKHGSRRDAIEQYKIVQDEFLAVFDEKKKMEMILYCQHKKGPEHLSSQETSKLDAEATTEAQSFKKEDLNASCGGKTKVKSEEPPIPGTVQERILMLEAAKTKMPSPPSNPSSLNSSSTESSYNVNAVSGSKKRNKGKKMGFLRGNRLGFASKLPSVSTKSSGNKVKT
ncbi:hypothetical protein IV203_023484 [Nitzschia inconspicua]|uniref:Uncharacterized protein n=1 Tax=Nitzschia inconspicua TaxID=303405 RepID=A0A9K3PBI5_9STRA|nr:hypothetical protein IV203_023484 [Nitzschia inconspicua]